MSTTYQSTNPTSRNLPGEEYRALKKAQEKAELNKHFAQPSLPSRSVAKTAYQKVDLTRNRRSQISEVKDATRRALGASFDFTDSGYNHSQRSSATSSRDSVARYEEEIPQRYIDEFNEKWVEDDLKYAAEQYATDSDGSASWRTHQDMYEDIKPLPHRYNIARGYLAQNSPDSRVDSVMEEECRPQLTSKWSISTINCDEELKKRSLSGRRS